MKSFIQKLNFLKKFQLILPILFLLGIILDIFYFKNNSDIRFFSLLLLWILITKIYSLKSDLTFKLCLVYLAIIFFFMLLNKNPLRIERLSVWIFLFLLVGVVQQIFEFRAKAKKR